MEYSGILLSDSVVTSYFYALCSLAIINKQPLKKMAWLLLIVPPFAVNWCPEQGDMTVRGTLSHEFCNLGARTHVGHVLTTWETQVETCTQLVI